jgi:hypothetical protein
MSLVPSQILYLEHGSCRLYAEAVQVIETRRLCWARPTLLIEGLPAESDSEVRQEIIAAAAASPEASTLKLYDLKDCPDLIWPIALFQIACDIDFFALLVQTKMNADEATALDGSSQLNAFIRSFWHSHAHLFQKQSDPRPSIDAR